jgi:hypothetical protein
VCAETRSGNADDAQALDAAHAQIGIEHAIGVAAHAARADRMADRRRRAAQVRVDVGVARRLRARCELLAAIGVEHRLMADLARHAEALTQLRDVGRRGEVVVLDAHRRVRIGRSQAHRAAALGVQDHRVDAPRVGVRLDQSGKIRGRGDRRAAQHELEIGHLELRARLDVALQTERHRRRGPGAEEVRLEHRKRDAIVAHQVVERARFSAALPQQHALEVVLQVVAHRQRDDRRDAHLAQMFGRPDAGEHQQLR